MKSDYATPLADLHGYIAEAKRFKAIVKINNAGDFSGRHKK